MLECVFTVAVPSTVRSGVDMPFSTIIFDQRRMNTFVKAHFMEKCMLIPCHKARIKKKLAGQQICKIFEIIMKMENDFHENFQDSYFLPPQLPASPTQNIQEDPSNILSVWSTLNKHPVVFHYSH